MILWYFRQCVQFLQLFSCICFSDLSLWEQQTNFTETYKFEKWWSLFIHKCTTLQQTFFCSRKKTYCLSHCSKLADFFKLWHNWGKYTAILEHEFSSDFWNCPLVFCSHSLYYAIQAFCDISQCSLRIKIMWRAVFTNKVILRTKLHKFTTGAKNNIKRRIFFRNGMAADIGL